MSPPRSPANIARSPGPFPGSQTHWAGLLAFLCAITILVAPVRGAPYPASVPPRGQPLSLQAYIAVVRGTRDLLRADVSGAHGGTMALRAAASLRRAVAVQTPGGTIVPDNSAILADLTAAPPRLGMARARLTALLVELEQQHGGTPDRRALLDQVFGEPPFAGGQQVSLFDYLSRQLLNWIAGLLSRLFPGGGEGAGNATLVVLVAGAAAVIAVVIVGGSRGLLSRLAPAGATAGDPQHPEAGLDSAGARRLGAQAAGEGDYRTALRFSFLAILLDLDARDVVRFDPAAADRDLVRQARHHNSAVGDLLGRAAHDFATVWYGHHPCGVADYRAMNDLAARIQAEGTADTRGPA